VLQAAQFIPGLAAFLEIFLRPHLTEHHRAVNRLKISQKLHLAATARAGRPEKSI
jgi:hypothetical protein